MRNIRTALLILIFACLVIALNAQEVNVTGDWELTIETPRGEMTWKVHFLQEGEDLAVTMKGPRGDEITGEGTVKENKVEWSVTRSTPRGEMTTTYKGTVDGEKMTGEAQFGPGRIVEWTAVKKGD
ncbi:MAG: hypothetical protein IBX60_00720 [Candidatus Aminicenantes bacterium]|nr:hypothetical protein [Candidatus Aminicenantes bacterium]